jgi:hypothetical protein
MPAWRFEPIEPERFPKGETPFRARGLAYGSLLDYVNRRNPGALPEVQARIRHRPSARYLEQLFVSLGDYDAAPLMSLFLAAAALEGVPVSSFIERRSSASAKADAGGMWKPLLSAKSLDQLIERLPVAFNRYYSPCRARVTRVTNSGFSGELSLVPAQMNGLYVFSTVGFVGACLALAGCENVAFTWDSPQKEGSVDGVPTDTLGFEVSFDPR